VYGDDSAANRRLLLAARVGSCPADEEAHWSTTEAPTFPGSYFYFNFRRSNMNFNIPSGAEYSVRCVALAQ
jgi:hypothetical protein